MSDLKAMQAQMQQMQQTITAQQSQLNNFYNTGRSNTQPQQEEESGWSLKKILSGINPANWFNSLDLGSLFWMVVIGVAAFALARSEAGQEFIQDMMTNHLSPENQLKVGSFLNGMFLGPELDMGNAMINLAKKDPAKLKKMMVESGTPEAMVDIIAKNPQTVENYVNLVRQANITKDENGKPKLGKFQPETAFNKETIFALLTTKSTAQMAKELAVAALNGDGAKSATGGKVLEALRDIAKTDKLEMLFNQQNRANTTDLIEALAKKASLPVTTAHINQLIDASVVDADGKKKFSDDFRTFLNEALTPDKEGQLPFRAAFDKYAEKNQTVRSIKLDIVNAAPAPTPAAGQGTSPAPAAGAAAGAAAATAPGATPAPGASPAPAPAPAAGAAPAPTATPGSATEELDKFKRQGNNLNAMNTLRATLKDEKYSAFTKHLETYLGGGENKDISALATMALHKDNFAAFQAFAKTADFSTLSSKEVRASLEQFRTFPAEAAEPALAILKNGIEPFSLKGIFLDEKNKTDNRYVINNLLEKGNREVIEKAGTKNVADLMKVYAPQLAPSENMLKAMLAATESMATNNDIANDTTRRDTYFVAAAIADRLMKNDASGITNLSDDQFGTFINNPKNVEMLKTLITNTKDELSPMQKAQAEVILSKFGTLEKLAANKKDGAPFLRTFLSKPADKDCSKKGLDNEDKVLLKAAEIQHANNIIGSLIRNGEIGSLAEALKAAGCTANEQSTQVAPGTTPAAPAPARAAGAAAAPTGSAPVNPAPTTSSRWKAFIDGFNYAR